MSTEMTRSHSIDQDSKENKPSFEHREQTIRHWIAQKESVCPYAPGLVRFIELPDIPTLAMKHVHHLSSELKAFYDAKEKGKRVGRWILLPKQEWQSHNEAQEYSERVFWLLNAAYYFLVDDRKKVKACLLREMDGLERGYHGEINNPIIGKLPSQNSKVIPARSLFCSALGPLYKSKQFYRYNPYSAIVLVYLSEFVEKKKRHPKAARKIALDMAYSSLFEHFGDDLKIDIEAFEKELPIWGAIIDKTAELIRANNQGMSALNDSAKGRPESNLQVFRNSPPQLASAFYSKYKQHLPIMHSLSESLQIHPKDILNACFAGTGLYTSPDYPKSTFNQFNSPYER